MRLDNKLEAEEEKLARDEQSFEAEKLAEKKPAAGNKKTRRKMTNREALKFATSIMTEPQAPELKDKKAAKKITAVFQEGALVSAGSMNSKGVLVEEIKKGLWQVQFGSIKMTMKEKDLRLIHENPSVETSDNAYRPDISIELADDASKGFYERPAFELRLLGMRTDEAIKTLEHQIDLCVLHNFPHFSVIHGKGDGVLMQAVSDYLSHSPVIAEFSRAPAEDGGAGKTYVTLK